MKSLRVIVFLTLLCCGGVVSYAQDVQFSQFYAAPLYLNPAFTGSSERGRAGLNFRRQWPAFNHSFTTVSAFTDYHMKNLNSGVGLIVNQHQEDFLGFQSTEVGFLYAYKLKVAENLVLRAGAQGSLFSKNVNFEDLIFGDQIDIVNGQALGASGEVLNVDANSTFLSLSSGLLLYTNDFWFGASVHHINQPNQSFMDQNSPLKRKYSFHIGYKFDLASGNRLRSLSYQFQERSFTLAANYKRQGGFSQFDFGAQLYLQPLVFGLSYRGLPFSPLENLFNSDALITLVGVELNQNVSMAYSYDFTISKLANASGGAHEISLTFRFGKVSRRSRRDTILPCFKY